jgi:hypothetical protein
MSLLDSLHLPPPRNRAAAPDAAKAAAAKAQKLTEAAAGWRRTLDTAAQRVNALKSSVQAHYAGGPPQLYPEVVKSLGRLDDALHCVDASLADSLARAGRATDAGARQAELDKVKGTVARFVRNVRAEPLIGHMDRNPFGVTTGLQPLLLEGLTQAAKAIG